MVDPECHFTTKYETVLFTQEVFIHPLPFIAPPIPQPLGDPPQNKSIRFTCFLFFFKPILLFCFLRINCF